MSAELYTICCRIVPTNANYALNLSHVYEVLNRPRTALTVIRTSLCLSVCLSVCLFVCCLFVCLRVYVLLFG